MSNVVVVGAGAECSPRWNGYMEGAVRSGEATAEAVATQTGPPAGSTSRSHEPGR